MSNGRCERHGNPILTSAGECRECMASPRTFGWSASPVTISPRVTKTIEYICGCSMTLSNYSHRDAHYICEKHLQSVRKITTTEEYV